MKRENQGENERRKRLESIQRNERQSKIRVFEKGE